MDVDVERAAGGLVAAGDPLQDLPHVRASPPAPSAAAGHALPKASGSSSPACRCSHRASWVDRARSRGHDQPSERRESMVVSTNVRPPPPPRGRRSGRGGRHHTQPDLGTPEISAARRRIRVRETVEPVAPDAVALAPFAAGWHRSKRGRRASWRETRCRDTRRRGREAGASRAAAIPASAAGRCSGARSVTLTR